MSQAIQKAAPAQPVVKEKQKSRLVLDVLESRKDEIAKLCGAHLTPDVLFRISVNVIAKVPKVALCNVASLVQSIITFAEWGLQPNPALGLCYLVPYKDVATPMLGYRGMIELGRRSGFVHDVEARIVREGEKFSVKYGFNPEFEHIPGWDTDQTAIGVWSMATLKTGGRHLELMSAAQVEKARARSKTPNDGPWATDWEEMAKKTVVRRMMKMLPMTQALAEALEKDDENYIDGEVTQRAQIPATRNPYAAKALKAESHSERIEAPQFETVPVGSEEPEAPAQQSQVVTSAAASSGNHLEPPGTVADADDPDTFTDTLISNIRAAKDMTALKGLATKASSAPPDRQQEVLAAYAARKKELS